jgi:transposase
MLGTDRLEVLCMRGDQLQQVTMLSSLTPDQLVPTNHPIRRIKPIVDRAMAELSPTFDAMYAKVGRPSIPPERLLKSSILMALYSVRSERQFCERLQYDLLFKWFLDMNAEDPAFDATTFSKNRERLLDHEVSKLFFAAVLEQAKLKRYISSDHFTVDGTLLESWASFKSLRPRGAVEIPEPHRRRKAKGRNPHVNFKGKKRSNQTHFSTTDPDARLARKGLGREARICLSGHVLMENRNGLVVDVEVASPSGFAEREVGLKMLKRLRRRHRKRRLTVGGDKGYDTRDFVEGCRQLNVTPHVARNMSEWRRSAIDERTARHDGYVVSQRVRKRVEEIFGWTKTVGGGRKLRYVGVRRNQLWAELTAATFNLVRISNLMAEVA